MRWPKLKQICRAFASEDVFSQAVLQHLYEYLYINVITLEAEIFTMFFLSFFRFFPIFRFFPLIHKVVVQRENPQKAQNYKNIFFIKSEIFEKNIVFKYYKVQLMEYLF